MKQWLLLLSLGLYFVSCKSWQDKDLYIPEIFVNARQEVYLIVKNQGHTRIDEANIDLVVYWDALPPITLHLDSLDPHFRRPGDSSILRLPIVMDDQAHTVAARIDTKNTVTETDEDHNVYLRSLSSGERSTNVKYRYPDQKHTFDEPAYNDLMERSVMADKATWYERGQPFVLKYWQPSWKSQLKDQIKTIYEGESIFYPDSLTKDFTRDQAFDIYLRYLAHSLYIEQEQLMPWSIKSFAPEDYNELWDASSYFDWDSIQKNYHYGYQAGGAVKLFHPLVSYLAANALLSTSPPPLEQSLSTLFRFIRGYFNHTERSGLIYYQDVETTWFPGRDQLHSVFSCWATGGMILEFCRATNIPVIRADIELYNGLHTQLHFPTLGWHLTHADDLYDPMFYPISKDGPVSEVMMNENEYYAFKQTKPICIKDSCHTRGIQNTYDRRRWMVHKASGRGLQDAGTGFLAIKQDESLLSFKTYLVGDEFPNLLQPLFSTSEQIKLIEQSKTSRRDLKMMKVRYLRYLACKNSKR